MPRELSRALAASLIHTTCPRCGTGRAATQQYCVECGIRLPVATGAIASLRRAWVRTLGWYPGDWAWPALFALLFAAGGAAAVILVHRPHSVAAAVTSVARAPRPLGAVGTSPTARNGQTRWPDATDGWTVVLLSSPATKGVAHPALVARNAARRGLPEVGVLSSAAFGSLHPGYDVVFSGIYGTLGDAQVALQTARARGFGGAYTLQVAA